VRPQPLDFAEFYRRSADECLRTVLASVGDQHAAQELVDEAFARACASWRTVSKHPAPTAVVGSGTVGGVPTVKLSGYFGGSGTLTYWVNATTYLPFRFTSASGGTSVFQMNLQWLPPTAANLARVNVAVPAGFTQVPPPRN
jgi:hypothetical protein